MLVKIINKNSIDYDKEFKVRRMNYDQVVVNYPTGKGIMVFDKNEVKLIIETQIDRFLVENHDLLKIKLNRGISVTLYKVILDNIESQFNIKFKSMNLLKDKYSVNKRGIWTKEIIVMINETVPLKINVTGKNFKKSGLEMSISEIFKDEFLEICNFEMKRIREKIREKEEILSRYIMAIEKIKTPENRVKMLI